MAEVFEVDLTEVVTREEILVVRKDIESIRKDLETAERRIDDKMTMLEQRITNRPWSSCRNPFFALAPLQCGQSVRT